MELLRQDQLWEISRTRQAELLKEAREAQLRNSLKVEQMPWWASLARRLQGYHPEQIASEAYENPANRISPN